MGGDDDRDGCAESNHRDHVTIRGNQCQIISDLLELGNGTGWGNLHG